MSLIAVLTTGVQAGVETIAPALVAADNPVADFSDTPWWLSLVKAVLVLVFLIVNTLLVIWFERRVIGRMQFRPGPNRAGPFGVIQSVADGLKLLFKEDVTPKNADKVVFVLAPIIACSMAFISFAIIPMGAVVTMFGHRTPLQLTDCRVVCAPPHRSSPTRSPWVCHWSPSSSTAARCRPHRSSSRRRACGSSFRPSPPS